MTAGTDERRPSRAALALSALPIARARLRWPIPRTRVSVSAFDIAWLVAVAYIYVALIRLGYRGDAFVYWNSGNVGYPTVPVSGFVYPPPALLVFWPAHLVPFELFYAAWLVVLMGVMRWAIGPWLMLPFIFPNALGWHALGSGNVSLLVGAGVAYGLERRAAWLVPVLTKVTPVIGLGWFLVRREWRPLGVAIGWIFPRVGRIVRNRPRPLGSMVRSHGDERWHEPGLQHHRRPSALASGGVRDHRDPRGVAECRLGAADRCVLLDRLDRGHVAARVPRHCSPTPPPAFR